jgi:hypothetical protein
MTFDNSRIIINQRIELFVASMLLLTLVHLMFISFNSEGYHLIR